jgi:CheY-like chemotaxis protein
MLEDQSRIKVLLVEDDLIAKKVVTSILSDLYCEVDTAADVNTAIHLLKENIYDMVLADIGLPALNGFDLAREIRKLDNIQCNIPIIALTAYTDKLYKERCLKAGMNGFIAKPLTMELAQTLIEKVKKKRSKSSSG